MSRYRVVMIASAIILSLNTSTEKGHAEKPDANAQVAQAKDTKEMGQLREAAKNRKRRIIYNNDGDDICFGEQSSPQDFLSKRIIPALNTQVDKFF